MNVAHTVKASGMAVTAAVESEVSEKKRFC